MFALLQTLVVTIIAYAAFGGAVWGLIDAVRAPSEAYTSAGKQTKVLWVVLLSIATALLFYFLPFPLGGGSGAGVLTFLGLASSAVTILYFVSVRPAIAPYRTYRGDSGRGSRGGRSTGGW